MVDVIDLPETPLSTSLPALVYNLDQSGSSGHVQASMSELDLSLPSHVQDAPPSLHEVDASAWVDVFDSQVDQDSTGTSIPSRIAKATKIRRRQARKVSEDRIPVHLTDLVHSG
jgi:hypothetical protein